ncbi:hypothetical protein R5R35_002114 [Gryllus longicercus]|uniref:Phosphatidylethanolamine binding protein n=1 Tax=Gryllus longicercus TaxID=2509291 RepID=A0AAN9VV55_9ORTH
MSPPLALLALAAALSLSPPAGARPEPDPRPAPAPAPAPSRCFLSARSCRQPPPASLDTEVPFACAVPGLEVTSWSRAVVISAANCNEAEPKQEFQDQPEVRFPKASPDAFYTLVMVDPDAPGMLRGEYWLHWIVVNIKGSHFQIGNLDDATEVASYVAPAPPERTGAHRYIFLALEQEASASPLAPAAPAERPHFRLGPWLRGLRALCGPRAGVQFRAAF